jgi:hypothetical protein
MANKCANVHTYSGDGVAELVQQHSCRILSADAKPETAITSGKIKTCTTFTTITIISDTFTTGLSAILASTMGTRYTGATTMGKRGTGVETDKIIRGSIIPEYIHDAILRRVDVGRNGYIIEGRSGFFIN